MNTKSPGETAREAYAEYNKKFPMSLQTDYVEAWECLAQTILTAHTPKITGEDIKKLADRLIHKVANTRSDDLTDARIGDLRPAFEAIISDHLSTPKAPAQEQEWIETMGSVLNKFKTPWDIGFEVELEQGWTPITVFPKDKGIIGNFANDGLYRRPRQPQQAGKERKDGMDAAWPRRDVLLKLCDAAQILFDKYDYDADKWEEIQHCIELGRQYASKESQPQAC